MDDGEDLGERRCLLAVEDGLVGFSVEHLTLLLSGLSLLGLVEREPRRREIARLEGTLERGAVDGETQPVEQAVEAGGGVPLGRLALEQLLELDEVDEPVCGQREVGILELRSNRRRASSTIRIVSAIRSARSRTTARSAICAACRSSVSTRHSSGRGRASPDSGV